MCKCNAPKITAEERAKIDEIIGAHKNEIGGLIPALHKIQEYYGYLPYEVQKIVALGMDVPISDVYGVVSFYSRFSTSPMGKYKVSVCMGTACYVKGADKLLSQLENMLEVSAGGTTHDGMFTVEATRCVGACGLAPVLLVNEDVYGKVASGKTKEVLDKYRD